MAPIYVHVHEVWERFQQLSVVKFFRKWFIRPGSQNEADKYTRAFI